MRTTWNVAALVLGLLLGGGTVAAWGATTGNTMQWVGAGGMVWKAPDGSVRSLSNPYWEGFGAAVNGGVEGRLGQSATMKGGGTLAVAMKRAIPAAAVGQAAAAVAFGSGPVALAAIGITLAPWIWDEVQGWLKPVEDDGAPVSGKYWYFSGSATCSTVLSECTFQEAVDARLVQLGAGWVYAGVYAMNASSITGDFVGPIGQHNYALIQFGGVAPIDPQPATQQELADYIVVQGVQYDKMSDIAQFVLDSGHENELVQAAQPLVSSGPSSIPGETTTSTTSGPAGQTTTTNNTTHNITYNSNVITVTTTTVSTTVAPDGTTTTETTTDGTQDVPAEEKPKPFCELYPDSSACAELGETPDEEIDEEVRNVALFDYQTVAGSCPSPMQFSVAGHAQEISYEFICDGAEALRPLLIALGMLSAGLFVFGAIGGKQA